VADYLGTVCGRQPGTVVYRTVVDHDELETLSKRLPPCSSETPIEPLLSVKGADDDADERSASSR
jgi:hypothetical protein